MDFHNPSGPRRESPFRGCIAGCDRPLCVDLTSIRLIGRRVYLRFDPEDLTRLDVFWEGRRAAG